MAVGMILFSVLVIQSVSGVYGVIFQHIVLSNGLDAYDTWMMLRVMLVFRHVHSIPGMFAICIISGFSEIA